ncbi:MAG: hypothetical protein HC892_16545 [Saprospiraceae bacterium]|nr:hypothetical protein [Saprospiraceae bacterium]
MKILSLAIALWIGVSGLFAQSNDQDGAVQDSIIQQGNAADTTILVTFIGGTISEGVYTEYTIDNSEANKIVLTLKGSNVPDLNSESIGSIEIFGTNKERPADAEEDKGRNLNAILSNPVGKQGQITLNKKVVIKTLAGEFLEGTYSGFGYAYNAFKAKYTITLKGKKLPTFDVAEVKSIVIER